MADFQFLQDPINKNWVVMAPRRAKRPDESKGTATVCPFCPGNEVPEEEVYRIPSLASQGESLQGWQVRVIRNKFPFAPIHEVIIHSPDHHKNFDTLPLQQIIDILKTYQKRYLLHQDRGQVYIFHNRGEMGGESLPHPHSQLTVIPQEVVADIPKLSQQIDSEFIIHNSEFFLMCPKVSQWPDEVWIVPASTRSRSSTRGGGPNERNKSFGEITEGEIADLATTLQRLIQLFDIRYKKEFPFNFYIYPGSDWYLRLIPRIKTLGGFELGTNIYVNTQDPKETIAFLQKHFTESHLDKIALEYEAEYERRV